MKTIAIVWVLAGCLIIYAFSSRLQVRAGRGRIVQGNVAVGSMQGVPIPTGPGVGLPHFTRDGKPSGQ